jgi:hypothetical protein
MNGYDPVEGEPAPVETDNGPRLEDGEQDVSQEPEDTDGNNP